MHQPLENQQKKRPAARPGGFTLVELLITITIVGILAGVVLAAVQSARETAKIAKTKATITKLHYIIMSRYDSYRTRRVPIDIKEYVLNHSGVGDYYYGWNDSQAYAHARLNAIRDLMRMEMPDRWSDVVADTTEENPLNMDLVYPIVSNRPAISQRFFRLYRQAHEQAGADHNAILANASAECLYMIVMSIPEAAEQFQNTEIGDVDDDGLKEFIDAWGHPVRFIRWPVGLVNYERLTDLRPGNYLPNTNLNNQTGPAGSDNGPVLPWDLPSDLQFGDRQTQPDAFDSMGVGGGFAVITDTASGNSGPGYVVYPLIYSAGPDGIYDINFGRDGSGIYAYSLDSAGLLDIYQPMRAGAADDAGNTLRYMGQPLDGDAIDGTPKNDELDHYDNITNHMLEVR